MFTYEGISTTLLAMNAPRRATAGGTILTPDAASWSSERPANLVGTLS
jgi:hypothetical protein